MDALATERAREWQPSGVEGVEICVLHKNAGKGGAALLRFRKGARFPLHNHPGGEDVFMISGRMVVAGKTLVAGDYLWTEPGAAHDATAEEDTVFYVSAAEGIEILEK